MFYDELKVCWYIFHSFFTFHFALMADECSNLWHKRGGHGRRGGGGGKIKFSAQNFSFFRRWFFSSLGTTSLGLFCFSFAFITRRWRLQVFSYGKKMVFKKSYWNRSFYYHCQTQTQTHKMQVDYCVNVKFFLLEWKLIFFVWREIFSWLTFIHIH